MVRLMRERAGLTQEQIAIELSLNRSTVAKWETGVSMPRAEILPRLAKILSCAVDDLFQIDEKEVNNDGDAR